MLRIGLFVCLKNSLIIDDFSIEEYLENLEKILKFFKLPTLPKFPKNTKKQHFAVLPICFYKVIYLLIVLSLNLEVSLRVSTYRANLWSLLADYDVTAVRALPDHIALTREDQTALNVLQ